jgi:hypothetical protein
VAKKSAPKKEVEAAVKRDVAAIGKRDSALAKSALAASAVALARELDDPTNSATSKSMCSRSLLETMNRLRELAPAEKENDQLDELNARRAARTKRRAAS